MSLSRAFGSHGPGQSSKQNFLRNSAAFAEVRPTTLPMPRPPITIPTNSIAHDSRLCPSRLVSHSGIDRYGPCSSSLGSHTTCGARSPYLRRTRSQVAETSLAWESAEISLYSPMRTSSLLLVFPQVSFLRTSRVQMTFSADQTLPVELDRVIPQNFPFRLI